MTKLISYKEAAARLDVPVNTLRVWVNRKRIPYIRLGKRTVKFDPDALMEWVNAGRIEPSNDQESPTR